MSTFNPQWYARNSTPPSNDKNTDATRGIFSLSSGKPSKAVDADMFLLDDTDNDLGIMDTRKLAKPTASSVSSNYEEKLPEKITGTYNEDYNILYIDEVIRKKITQEKYSYLAKLKSNYKALEIASSSPQTYGNRQKTLSQMENTLKEISQIENGEKLLNYDNRVKDIIAEYKKHKHKPKTIIFDMEEEQPYEELDDEKIALIVLIEKYLEIASDYIYVDIIRINNRPTDICNGCGTSLAKVAPTEAGTIRCPNEDCQTEHDTMIMVKHAKDGNRINSNSNTEDESIENFLRALSRYCGGHVDVSHSNIDDELYTKLDTYFINRGRLPGSEIRKLPLNNRGRRGDTDHKMLWTALYEIKRSELYEDANLIGHIYWGWKLPQVLHLRERIIEKYNKTQRVFCQIPISERSRTSSLGTQYRLWRHLQLEGHECYMDEFKIAENPDSLRIHNKLWRMMCEGANDPDIYYIS